MPSDAVDQRVRYTVDPMHTFMTFEVLHFDTSSVRARFDAVALHCRHANDCDSPLLQTHVRGGDFEATLQRSRWGMDWGLDLGIPDDVRPVIQVELAQEKAA